MNLFIKVSPNKLTGKGYGGSLIPKGAHSESSPNHCIKGEESFFPDLKEVLRRVIMKTIFLPVVILLACAALSEAGLRTEAIEYKHNGTVLEGYLAYDDSVKGKRPAVLVVHEWWGLNDYIRSRTEQLARMGYVAFAIDMYGKGVLAKTPEEAGMLAGMFRTDRQLMRARAHAGLEVLRKHELTDTARIAAIGYCFGGGTVLELARSGADISGVVSFHGSLDNPNPADAKKIRTKVLVLHGGADPYVTPEPVMSFWKEMKGTDATWQINVDSGAVHSFTNPAAGSDPSKGAAYNERADKGSWEAMKIFFAEIFR
jgi:dienelactone hydrolase